MESRARLFGHAIHPILVVFPLGLLVSSLIFDIIGLAIGIQTLAAVSFWNIAAGVVGGLVAAVFGLIDWLAIPTGTRARAVGLWHGLGNVLLVVLFLISWLLRLGVPGYAPSTTAMVLSVIAVLLGMVTGWLGGELVQRLGVGVAPGANPNAPSSLSAELTQPQAGRSGERRGPAATG
jgi:uncharacterized membrane protein